MRQLRVSEINPNLRAAGRERATDKWGIMRRIYDYEMIFCYKGSMTVQFDNHSMTAKEGHMLIIPPNQAHVMNYTNVEEVYWIHFDVIYHDDQEDLQRYITEHKGLALSDKTFSEKKARDRIVIQPYGHLPETYKVKDVLVTKNYFIDLIELFEKKSTAWQLRAKADILMLLSEALIHGTQREDDHHKSKLILAYLRDNCYRKVSSIELSNQFHYHGDTLNRLVKKETGKSIREYLGIYRYERARQLLATTDLTLDEISRQCGYTDRSHLIKSFKQYTSERPSEIRRK